MDDFRIKISSDLDLSKAESKINNFLNKYNGKDKIKLNVDIGNINYSKQFESLGTSAGKSFETALQKQINAMAKSQRNAFSEPLNNLKKSQKSYIDFWEKELLKPKNKNYGKSQQSVFFDDYISQIKKQEEQVKTIKKRMAQGFSDVDTSSIRKSLNKYTGLDSNTLKEAEASYSKLISLQKELKTGISDDGFGRTLSDKSMISKWDQYNDVLEKCRNQIKVLGNEFSSISKPFSQIDAIAAGNKTLSWLKNNSKAAKDYEETLKRLAEQQKNATNHEDLRNYTKQVNAIKAEASALGKTGKSFREELSRGFKQIGQFAATYGILQRVPDLIFDSVSELKEMDNTLTEISKTSDLTISQIKQLGKDSFENASKYGKTANDYLIGVQEMSRSGFYGKQAEELAQLSILGQAAGDMNRDVSNSYLLATNAAYNYQGSVQKLNTVLDGQNMITNRNSVAMNDMAEATSKAASMASQTGVKVNELSAVIGTAVARTKQEGNVIGTALKSLFVNLQDTSNEKIVTTFSKLGISQTKFVNGSKQLKTPIELLKELSVAYSALPEGSQLKADVLRNIGQKRQANVLAAILGGMSSGDYDKMLSDYSQGMGSAAKEAEKSANNWQGSLNKLSNAWTSFISNFANTDLIIGATNALTGFVKVLDTLTSNPLLLGGTAGVIGGGIAFAKNLD